MKLIYLAVFDGQTRLVLLLNPHFSLGLDEVGITVKVRELIFLLDNAMKFQMFIVLALDVVAGFHFPQLGLKN